MKTTQRIVRSKQGSWRWQTPYRVHTYRIVPTADGKELRWELTHRSAKQTLAKIRKHWPELDRCGGLGRRKIDTTAAREAIYNKD